jgi:hypothetical protein
VTRTSSIFAFVLMLVLGLVGGAVVTWKVLGAARLPGTVSYGPWVVWPKAGTLEADPYSRAFFAKRGDIPMTPAEGLAFFASSDQSSEALDGRCRYRIEGIFPTARAWTLTVYRSDGRIISNPAGRMSFTSAEAIVESGVTRIELSSTPTPGNWLPLADKERFIVALRFYDTPLSAIASVLEEKRLPKLELTACNP